MSGFEASRPVGASKFCVRCGIDVRQQQRTKDSAGNYYCQPCYHSAASAVTSPAEDMGAETDSSLTDEVPFVYVPPTTSSVQRSPARSTKKAARKKSIGVQVWVTVAAIIVVVLAVGYYKISSDRDELRAETYRQIDRQYDQRMADAEKTGRQAEADLAEAKGLRAQATNLRSQADVPAAVARQITRSEAMDNDPFISRLLDRYPDMRVYINGDVGGLDAHCQLMVATGILTARQTQYIRDFSADIQKLPR